MVKVSFPGLKVFLLLIPLLAMSGCESLPQSLPLADKLNTPVISNIGAGYSDNLAAAYQRYYLEHDDFKLSRNVRDFFYNKAARAAREEKVYPVVVTNEISPESLRAGLLGNRDSLTGQRDRDHRPGDLQILAQAQAAFDCKVILILTGAKSDVLDICQRRFNNLMSRLQSPHWPQLEYHVFFKKGRSILQKDGIETLKEVARLKKKDRHARLMIVGNTDKSGSSEANYRLSVQRARGVRNILLQFGVRENEINLLEERDNFPAFFALEKAVSPDRQRRVSILVDRNLVK